MTYRTAAVWAAGLAAVLLAVLSGAPAVAMDVDTFLTKADAVQRKGVLAALSSDARPLIGELQSSTQALRAERLAARAAGLRPAYCPPEGTALKPDEIMAGFAAIPAAERSHVEVKDALRGLYAKRYPCPAA